MFYVINMQSKFVEHEDNDEDQAKQYVRNTQDLFGGQRIIVKGVKARKIITGY